MSTVFAFPSQIGHSGPMTTRRNRNRDRMTAEIKEAALAQLAELGPGALSVRGIARAIGMSPAGIYRYFDGLDDLITELITDAYDDLSDAIAAGSSGTGPAVERMRGAMLSYRQWCIEHPNRFLLIFGTPIPGYAAPEEGPTVVANRRIGEVFFSLGVEAWRRGELAVSPDDVAESQEVELAAMLDPDLPAGFVGRFLSTWAHFHGLVTLEILHQLDWVYPAPDRVYEREIDRMLELLTGSPAPT